MINKEIKELRVLSVTGWLEAISFVLLLGLAMPLKYYWEMYEPVKYIGMTHGVLFMAYLMVLFSAASKLKLPLWAMPMGFVASVLPMGPVVFDRVLKRSLNSVEKY